MPITDKFFAINIRKYLALGDDHEAGEPALIQLLSGFSCPKNPDVEHFLKKNAIEMAGTERLPEKSLSNWLG